MNTHEENTTFEYTDAKTKMKASSQEDRKIIMIHVIMTNVRKIILAIGLAITMCITCYKYNISLPDKAIKLVDKIWKKTVG